VLHISHPSDHRLPNDVVETTNFQWWIESHRQKEGNATIDLQFHAHPVWAQPFDVRFGDFNDPAELFGRM